MNLQLYKKYYLRCLLPRKFAPNDASGLTRWKTASDSTVVVIIYHLQ